MNEDKSLYEMIEAKPASFHSDEAALSSYTNELGVLANKYGKTFEELLDLAHSSCGEFNADFERAISLGRRIRFIGEHHTQVTETSDE